jgi:hypothetical protein
MKLGEMKENRISRATRIMKGAYFLIVTPTFPPRLDRNAGRLFIHMSPSF